MLAGRQYINVSELDAVAAIHQATAQQVQAAHEGLLARGKLSSRPYLPVASHFFPDMNVSGTEDEAKLEAMLNSEIEKVLAIMALVIAEMQVEIGGMTDILDMINSLDDEFFQLACGMMPDLADDGGMTPDIFRQALFHYVKKSV